MTLEEIEKVIVALLAAELGEDMDAYRAELAAAGPSLPCDSVVAVEIMVKVEKRCEVQLEMNVVTARAMRSVKSFAALVEARRTATYSTPSPAEA